MSETVLTIEDAARCLPDVVERVRASGKAALLTRAGEPMARIVPITADEKDTESLIAFLRRWRIEHPDPDEQFAEALRESRQGVRPPQNPWD